MRHKESDLQTDCIFWIRIQYPKVQTVPSNADFKFSGNDIRRMITGKRMKDMGYIKGTPDLFIALGNAKYNGLWIEFKSEKGKQTKEQLEFQKTTEINGFKYEIVRDYDYFKEIINKYINDDNLPF